MKLWDFVRNDIPNNIIIYPEIVMYQLVSHPRHCSPFKLRVFVSYVSRNFQKRLFSAFRLEGTHLWLNVLIGPSGIQSHPKYDVGTQEEKVTYSTSFRI